MSLYWSCQNLQSELQIQTDRKKCIMVSIKENLAKYGVYKSEINFESDLTWFNTSDVLNRHSFEGLITILDFFTYCCINCMHILPDLEKLEKLFPTELAVIGVHSAKFDNEKSEAQLEHALQRYRIEHPVCNDKALRLWNRLGITCWPTLLVLAPSGTPIHIFMGEGHTEFIAEYLDIAVQYFRESGELGERKIPRSVRRKTQGSLLKYPGKIILHQEFLVVSDSGNNRVLLIRHNSNETSLTVVTVIGSGSRGAEDGHFENASFNNPQGLCSMGDNLIVVADTDNHLLRLINLKSERVITLGGTGEQGTDKVGGKPGPLQPISSPWDVTRVNEKCVAVAMAGIHQIWLYCFDEVTWWKGVVFSSGTLVRISGSGAEENRNNSYPTKAGFAQPSGLSIDCEYQASGALFIADSESSTIRRMDLKDGSVKNVCGGERDPCNLFAYGDVDGVGIGAKLQHPLAVAWNKQRSELYIADSYNHKIKKVTGPKNECKTLLGGDNTTDDNTNNPARLSEPGGLTVSPDGYALFIADTNNHQIKILNLDTGEVKELDIQYAGTAAGESDVKEDTAVIKHNVNVPLGEPIRLLITASTDHPDYKLNTEAKSVWTLFDETSTSRHLSYPSSGELTNSSALSIVVEGTAAPLSEAASPTQLRLSMKLLLCSKSSGFCVAKRVQHAIQLLPSKDTPSQDVDGTVRVDIGSLISI